MGRQTGEMNLFVQSRETGGANKVGRIYYDGLREELCSTHIPLSGVCMLCGTSLASVASSMQWLLVDTAVVACNKNPRSFGWLRLGRKERGE